MDMQRVLPTFDGQGVEVFLSFEVVKHDQHGIIVFSGVNIPKAVDIEWIVVRIPDRRKDVGSRRQINDTDSTWL